MAPGDGVKDHNRGYLETLKFEWRIPAEQFKFVK
jgi:hypothetical protein